MKTVLALTIDASLWWAAVVKLLHLRHSPHDRPLRALNGLIVCLALAPVLAMPGLRELAEEVVPGLPKLLLSLLNVAATYGLMAFFGYSVDAPGTALGLRRRFVGLLLVQAVLVLNWLCAAEQVRIGPAATQGLDDHRNALVVVISLGYIAYLQAHALYSSSIYARAAPPGRVRASLRTVCLAIAFLLTACLTKVATALALLLVAGLHPDHPVLVAISVLPPALTGLGAVLLAAGLCYPVLAALPGRFRRARERWLLYRRLGPLWQRMSHAFTHLVLAGDSVLPVAVAGWRPWTYRAYYRRVIEIRDTIVQLAPYYDPQIASRSPSGDQDIRVRAALTADALRRRQEGRSLEHPHPLTTLGGDDLDSDARWLARLADELAALEAATAAARP